MTVDNFCLFIEDGSSTSNTFYERIREEIKDSLQYEISFSTIENERQRFFEVSPRGKSSFSTLCVGDSSITLCGWNGKVSEETTTSSSSSSRVALFCTKLSEVLSSVPKEARLDIYWMMKDETGLLLLLPPCTSSSSIFCAVRAAKDVCKVSNLHLLYHSKSNKDDSSKQKQLEKWAFVLSCTLTINPNASSFCAFYTKHWEGSLYFPSSSNDNSTDIPEVASEDTTTVLCTKKKKKRNRGRLQRSDSELKRVRLRLEKNPQKNENDDDEDEEEGKDEEKRFQLDGLQFHHFTSDDWRMSVGLLPLKKSRRRTEVTRSRDKKDNLVLPSPTSLRVLQVIDPCSIPRWSHFFSNRTFLVSSSFQKQNRNRIDYTNYPAQSQTKASERCYQFLDFWRKLGMMDEKEGSNFSLFVEATYSNGCDIDDKPRFVIQSFDGRILAHLLRYPMKDKIMIGPICHLLHATPLQGNETHDDAENFSQGEIVRKSISNLPIVPLSSFLSQQEFLSRFENKKEAKLDLTRCIVSKGITKRGGSKWISDRTKRVGALNTSGKENVLFRLNAESLLIKRARNIYIESENYLDSLSEMDGKNGGKGKEKSKADLLLERRSPMKKRKKRKRKKKKKSREEVSPRERKERRSNANSTPASALFLY
eukprot:g2103.t1